jgi:hypothetical protein
VRTMSMGSFLRRNLLGESGIRIYISFTFMEVSVDGVV